MWGQLPRLSVERSSTSLPALYSRRYHRAVATPQTSMLQEITWDPRYAVSGIEDVLTAALVMYPDVSGSNIDRTLDLLAGGAHRWGVPIKTAEPPPTPRIPG